MSYEVLIRLVSDLGLDGLDTTVYWFPDTSDQYLATLRRTAYKNAVNLTLLQNSRQNGLTSEVDCETQRFTWQSEHFRRFGSVWRQEGPFPLARKARLREACLRGHFCLNYLVK